MERTINFKDAEGNKVIFSAKLNEGKFSASGEYCGSLGQVFDHVSPRTDAQAALIELWRKYHLNDMRAGCEHQRAENWNKVRINPAELPTSHANKDEGGIMAICVKPSEHPAGLLTKPCQVCGYKYGTAWLKEELPADFEDTLNSLMDDIEGEEENERDRLIEESDIDLFQDFGAPETALALALMLGLSVNEINDIEEGRGNYWTVQGVDYLAGTDEEMDEEWDKALDNYIDECIDIPDHLEPYFDRDKWIDDAKIDGRGHALNRYNGGEESIEINGVYYYAYRQ